MMGLAIKQPKVPEGVDPKTIPCEFFKEGRCAKGWKCKFSHEKNTRKGTEKIDLFVDHRDDAEKEKDSDKMDDWDQDKLESVVKEKHSGENQNNKTDIVCKHFLEAVEKRLYGRMVLGVPQRAEMSVNIATPYPRGMSSNPSSRR